MERQYGGPRSVSLWPSDSPRMPSTRKERKHSISRKPIAAPSLSSSPENTPVYWGSNEPVIASPRDATPFIQPLSFSDPHGQYDIYGQRDSPKHPATSLIRPWSSSEPPHITGNGKRRQRIKCSQGWCVETVSALLSISIIIAIFAVLHRFDGQPLSDWDFQITVGSHSPVKISLNFVISLLGTLAKSTTAVVLSSGISQLKWNWFAAQDRPIRDFELFDSASRSARGSFQLIWRTRAKRVASLGGLLMILSLVFDPFLQLLIDYPGKVTVSPDHTVTLSMAHQYTGGSEIQHSQAIIVGPDQTTFNTRKAQPDANMVGAIQNALWNTNTRIQPTYSCPGGNCTWPDQASLAVCSTCHDISEAIKVTHLDQYSCVGDADASTMIMPNATQYSLESPYNMSFVECDLKLLQSQTTILPNETINFRDSQTLLTAFTALWSDSWNNITKRDLSMHAMECGLTLCSNTYRPEVQFGNYSEIVIESHSERASGSYQVADPSLSNRSYLVNGNWTPLGPSMDYPTDRTDFAVQLTKTQASLAHVNNFSLPQHSVDSLVQLIGPIFDPGNSSGTITYLQNTVEYDTLALQAIWSAPSLETVFSNLAYDLSSVIRTQGAQVSNNAAGTKQAASSRLTGSAQEYAVIIAIRWPFMAGPVTVVVLSAVFLLMTILQTRSTRSPVWKEGALATLVWGLDSDTRQMVREAWAQPDFKKQPLNLVFRGTKTSGELVHAKAELRG